MSGACHASTPQDVPKAPGACHLGPDFMGTREALYFIQNLSNRGYLSIDRGYMSELRGANQTAEPVVWQDYLERNVLNRTQVRQAPLAEALRDLRTTIPPFDLIGAGTETAALRWSCDPGRMSEDLSDAFWQFLALAEAPDEELVRFARQFGPLAGPAEGQFAPGKLLHSHQEVGQQASQGSQAEHVVEPLFAWRMYARGLTALFDALDPSLPVHERQVSREWLYAPLVVPLWLRGVVGPADQEYLASGLVAKILDENPLFGDSAETLLEVALVVAGVGPAFLLRQEPDRRRDNAVTDIEADDPTELPGGADDSSGGLSYTISGTLINAPDRLSGQLWQTNGLLPILTISLAFAVSTQERHRCSWCGKPAAKVKRAPRKGQPWYGDHDACRVWARTASLVRSEDKRAEERRARRGALAQATSTNAKE